MKRSILDGKTFLIGYHSQKWRMTGVLEKPIPCNASTAWLGIGYYFWTELEFARYWGEDKKKIVQVITTFTELC